MGTFPRGSELTRIVAARQEQEERLRARARAMRGELEAAASAPAPAPSEPQWVGRVTNTIPSQLGAANPWWANFPAIANLNATQRNQLLAVLGTQPPSAFNPRNMLAAMGVPADVLFDDEQTLTQDKSETEPAPEPQGPVDFSLIDTKGEPV